ncbi:helix-turn-helix transcriptional regulator [Sorangium sp. So ce269]
MDSLPFETLLLYVAANTRRLRQRRGMTQEALANAADLDLRFIQKIESGRYNISLRTLLAVASALEVAPNALLRRAILDETRRGRPPKARHR